MLKNTKNKTKLLLIFGTRPEVIKMAPIFWELNRNKDVFETLICITSQHKSLISKLLNSLQIKIDFNLMIMKSGQSLPDLTISLVKKINKVINLVNPDLIMVQGDTVSSYAGALTAFYNNIKICHVEAGLRSFDMRAPFPEEFYRKSISSIAYINFAPTKINKNNLLRDGVIKENIYVTGNTVIDCLIETLKLYNSNNYIKKRINKNLNNSLGFNWQTEKFILITGHRRENIGQAFENIMQALSVLAKNNTKIKFVYPIHPNPLIRKTFIKLTQNLKNFFIIEPLEYLEFSVLMSKCFFVMTDSGGIQEEAPSLGKPVLLMREKTERVEGIEKGVVKMVGSKTVSIIEAANLLLGNKNEYKRMSKISKPYGNGKAAKKIVKIVKDRIYE